MTGLSGTSSLLSDVPTASASAEVTIGHIQLRDLIVCPKERGVVWYASRQTIVEHNIVQLNSTPHVIARLTFTPVTLSVLPVDDGKCEDECKILVAAGGQDAELYLAMYSYMAKSLPPSSSSTSAETNETGDANAMQSEQIWELHVSLSGSINNSVTLYWPPPPAISRYSTSAKSKNLIRSPISRFPRLIVSNNDCTIKFFDISLSKAQEYHSASAQSTGGGARSRIRPRRGQSNRVPLSMLTGEDDVVQLDATLPSGQPLEMVGLLKLSVPVNHTSVSPDGSTLLTCGDSPTFSIHRIAQSLPGTSLTFTHLTSYTLPSPSSFLPPSSMNLYTNNITSCCFSTCWSPDGSKFVVSSQEGLVGLWDSRSREPLTKGVWVTERKSSGMGGASASEASNHVLRNGWRQLILEETTLVRRRRARFSGNRLGDNETANGTGNASSTAQNLPAIQAIGIAASGNTNAIVEDTEDEDEEVLNDQNTSMPGLNEEIRYREPTGYSVMNSGNRGWLPLQFEPGSIAPHWGVRCTKFMKTASGKDVLVFTEHASTIHIVDAETFETHETIQIPLHHDHPHNTASSPHSSSSSAVQGGAIDVSAASSAALTPSSRRFMPYRPQRTPAIPMPIPSPLLRIPPNPVFAIPHQMAGQTRILSPNRFISRSPEPLSASSVPHTRSQTQTSSPSPHHLSTVRVTDPPLDSRQRGPHVRRQLATRSAPPRTPFPIPTTTVSLTFGSSNDASAQSTANGAATDTDSDSERPVVIPPFFDEEHEEEVRRVLSRYGINSVSSARDDNEISRTMLRSAAAWAPHIDQALAMSGNARAEGERGGREDRVTTGTHDSSSANVTLPGLESDDSDSENGDGDATEEAEAEDGMEIDELVELECTPSRSTSPTMLENPHGDDQPVPSTSSITPATRLGPSVVPQTRTVVGVNTTETETAPRRRRERQDRRAVEMDIAGICFDPKGKYLYVATTDTVFEWKLKDAERRWFASASWA